MSVLCVCLYVCVLLCMCVSVHDLCGMCVSMHSCMSVCVCMCLCMCVCVCVCIQQGFEGQNKQVYYVTYFISCICFIKFID